MRESWLLMIRDVWEGIRTQPAKVGLSFMAVAVGISSLIVLIALLGGLQEKSRSILSELGVNVVGIFQTGEVDGTKADSLGERHAALLTSNLPECTISTMRRYDVPTLGTRKNLTVVATDDYLIQVRQWQMEDGRFLDSRDVAKGERNAVITKSLSLLWNWKVGNLIMLRNTPFKIVGIVSAGGKTVEPEFNDPGLMLGEYIVFVPKTITPNWSTSPREPGPGLQAIFLRVPKGEKFSSTLAAAQGLLSQPDYGVTNVSWVTPESLTSGLKKLQQTIKLTIGSIAILCLILGGTTLMSLMVANVRERVTEIGLRRALGATQWDIALLFILEACLVTGAAAATAVLITHVVLILGRPSLPVPLKLGWESLLIPILAALLLAILFSYWPARSAARISPSEALRNE